MAYDSVADEILYGGQAGGGKSDLLLGLAITKHKRSIIFRQEYTQIRNLIDRAHEILDPTAAKYNKTDHLWRNIPGGGSLEFGAVADFRDIKKYQGRPHDFIGVDEGAEHKKVVVLGLTAWLRTTNKSIRPQLCIASNPPLDHDGEWLVSRYAPWVDPKHPDPAAPGELRWYVTDKDSNDIPVDGPGIVTIKDEKLRPLSRTFIPATVDDNPAYKDSNYKAMLQALPEPLRSKLLYGDFATSIQDSDLQVIKTTWVRRAMDRWIKPTGSLDAIGIDVARGGRDKTVLAPRRGTVCDILQKFPGKDTPDGPSVCALVIAQTKPGPVLGIDILAVGSSPVDYLRDYNYDVVPINGNAKAVRMEYGEEVQVTDKSGLLRMRNLRAAMYWNLRELLENDEITLPDDPELLADLTAPRMRPTVSGIQIEEKDHIKARISRSPDCGDAVAYAFWVMPSSPTPLSISGISASIFGK